MMWEDFLESRRHPEQERRKQLIARQRQQDLKWLLFILITLAFIYGIPAIFGGWD